MQADNCTYCTHTLGAKSGVIKLGWKALGIAEQAVAIALTSVFHFLFNISNFQCGG
jgi:hypothetical protein